MPSQPLKVGMVSLGCPKNLVDSEVMLGTLARQDYQITSVAGEAEVLIVNTCGFIDKAKKESVDTILEMAKHKDSGACKKLIVTGCLVQGYAQELQKELPEVDAFLGSADYPKIAQVIADLVAAKKRAKGPLVRVSSPVYLYDENSPRILATPSYSAYLKMAEGCDHACAFCDIPRLRGALRSRSIESCVAEATQLARQGVRELNLISQDSSEYGRDLYGKPRLMELLQALDQVQELRWIRVHYLYPAFLTDALMDAMAEGQRLVKYVDLPLQHADDAMLKSMRRPGSFEANLKLLRRFRERVPGASMRSSFIVGYPGETDAQFRRLLEFLKEARLDRAGFFTYSQESATPSGSLPGQLPDKVKLERQAEASRLSAEISAERLKLKVGTRVEVLVEGLGGEGGQAHYDGMEHGEAAGLRGRRQASKSKLAHGRSQGDAPDIDGRVTIEARPGQLKAGDFVQVEVTASDTHDLHGILVP
jgi:ribosomal protein S12 methylthiotransferase